MVDPYLAEPAAAKLAEFFRAKGLATIKEEDGREEWYQDWLDYQAKHRLYASVLSPKQYSSLGSKFDLLKLTRFLEVLAYFSPGHGYSLQVSFLGLFSILMGSNENLKREAAAALESGGLFALGVSEKDHGSDLLSNEFNVTEITSSANPATQFIANGRKYYIGNSNCAAMVSILGRKHRHDEASAATRKHRAPFVIVALRPAASPAYRNIKKIRTLGVRAAFVGEFDVKDHPLPASDFIAEGRDAWDAVFGTVTLGKFFLGFGSIGICEHAMEEAIAHLRGRILYHKSVLEMPHIRFVMAQAYARLTAMKLYAYRALDYVHAASETERRYQLFCAVQKAKVSTEGVKVVAQLSECIGARGFESETYFESAMRDIQLIPGLEGSTHINLGQTAHFAERYFERTKNQPDLPNLKSVAHGDVASNENVYLMHAHSGRVADVAFAHFLKAYKPFKAISNVRRFVRQAKAFAALVRHKGQQPRAKEDDGTQHRDAADMRITLGMSQCMAIIAYAQLIAENALLFAIPVPVISAIFHLLVSDLSTAGVALAALPGMDKPMRARGRKLIGVPKTSASDWDDVAGRMNAWEGG